MPHSGPQTLIIPVDDNYKSVSIAAPALFVLIPVLYLWFLYYVFRQFLNLFVYIVQSLINYHQESTHAERIHSRRI